MNCIPRNLLNSAVIFAMTCITGCTALQPAPRRAPLPAAADSSLGRPETRSAVVRGQTPRWPEASQNSAADDNEHSRQPMQAAGQPFTGQQDQALPDAQPRVAWQTPQTITGQPFADAPGSGQPVQTLDGQNTFGPSFPPLNVPYGVTQPTIEEIGPAPPSVDLDVILEEARTGRFMFGMGVNSNLGVTGQIVIDERNFDWRRTPTSWDEIINGTAWRGAGQGFRLEAMPGSRVQRYLASFTEPYLYLPGHSDPFVLSLSGFYFDRRYFDWDERRIGGRISVGTRVTHNLSLTTALGLQNVNVHDPRVAGLVPELDSVLGDSSLFSGRFTITHDTRDRPFLASEGHLVELSYEQVFGTFDYPRGDLDYRKYFLVRERPDGSGRHTLSYSFRLGITGSQTPIFENYFAGGNSSLRGFEFRGASPVAAAGVITGGEFMFLGSVEYQFPLTADDMMRGVFFVDYGTVEDKIEINSDNYRVAPGFGLRVAIPALGPAPLALDFAFPVAHASTDTIQNFSFFMGFGR